MADATTVKKAARLLPSALEKIKETSGEERKAALYEFHEIIDGIKNVWVPDDAGLLEGVASAVEDLKELDSVTYSTELEHLTSFVRTSPSLWKSQFVSWNSREDYEKIMQVLEENRQVPLDEEVLGIIFRASKSTGRFNVAAAYLSGWDVFEESTFRRYVEGPVDEKTNALILGHFNFAHDEENALKFLNLLKYEKDDFWARVRIIEVLEHHGKAEIISELQDFPYDDIRDLQVFRHLGRLLVRNELPEIAMNVVSNGLKIYPEDYELLKLKAEALLMLKEKVESYEIFKHLAARDNVDSGVIINAINLAYEQKLYEECKNLIGSFPGSQNDPGIMGKKIDCELQCSQFSEALNDLNSALIKFPDNKELLSLKLKALVKLNNENEAFNLSREIIKLSPENEEASDYVMSWLSRRGEFDDIIKLCESNPALDYKYRQLYVASLIFEGETKNAIRQITENPKLLNEPAVLDAIFFKIRDDDVFRTLIEIYNELPEKKTLFKLVVNRLRGIRPPMEGIDDSLITSNTSSAVAYILSQEYYACRSPNLPDRIRTMLSMPKFKDVRAMLEFISSIYEGRISEDVIDSPKYLFPVTEALIKNSMLDKAESQLSRTSHSETDPFYRYSLSQIEFMKGNYTSSKKYIESALYNIRNADFLKLAIRIAIVSRDGKKLKEYLDDIAAAGFLDSFDFTEIYEQIVKSSLWDMAEVIIQSEAEGMVRNPWVLRLRRDLAMVLRDYKQAQDHSTALISMNQYIQDDVIRHIDILEKLMKEKETVSFLLDLETGQKNAWLEAMIGDAFYRQAKFSKALEHYSDAIKLGTLPDTIKYYADALIENGKYDRSLEIVKRTDDALLLLKIYQKTSNIPEALNLLKRLTFKKERDQQLVRYAADNLWYNTEIRDYLVGLYRQEGYSWLGRIITIRTLENGNKELALEIARNLNKNNPEDMDIVRLYINVLVKGGQREDAIDLILRSLKYCTEFGKCMDLTNSLMRLYYDDRDYESIVKFYETNPKYIDEKSLQFVIRSYMNIEKFDVAEKLMSKYEGTLLSKDIHSELRDDLSQKKEFMETILFVIRLLKLEYKAGKKFDRKEAFYKADIPVEKIDDVYEFLNSRDFYFDVNEEKYEILTRDVIQKAAKNAELESVRDLTINVIYNNLDRKDPIIARNVYIYIKDQMDIARRPKIKDDTLLKLLKVALKENVRQDVLHVAFNLKLGIAEALDVVTLMEYMTKMNQEGEY